MGSFLSRNSIISLLFLGLLTFAVSTLVGSDGDDGVLMSAVNDFTGESDSQPQKRTEKKPPQASKTAREVGEAAESAEQSEFYDDAELIDSAQGFDPTPMVPTPNRPATESDEAMIVQEVPERHSDRMVADRPAAMIPESDDYEDDEDEYE